MSDNRYGLRVDVTEIFERPLLASGRVNMMR